MKQLTTLIGMMSMVTESRRRDNTFISKEYIHKEVPCKVGAHTFTFEVSACQRIRTWSEPDGWESPGDSEEIGCSSAEDIELYPLTIDDHEFPDYQGLNFPIFKDTEEGMQQSSAVASSIGQAAARIVASGEIEGEALNVLRLITPELVHGAIVSILNQLAKEYPADGTMEDNYD
jgi:hypothetical protein